MKNLTIIKKIGFCITCMNRLHHLKETLIKNIEDNYLPSDVEFILLDYNSSDGLEEWVEYDLKKYIDVGILTYYKTLTPTNYLRSHSRNMAFRLSCSELVCNLDADNFLGKGFAEYMLQEFACNDRIFYTSNYSSQDIVGRLCVNKHDFMNVKGYNEAFVGYGFEDVELFDRLIKYGLKQSIFHHNKFSMALSHSNGERVSQEYMMKLIDKIYLSYISPFSTCVLLLYNTSKYEFGTIFDNYHFNINSIDDSLSINDRCMDERFRITITDEWVEGVWSESVESLTIRAKGQFLILKKNNSGLIDNQFQFYEISDVELQINIILLVTEALNFKKAKEIARSNDDINKDGFGKGFVYKNFNYKERINLK